MRIEDFEKHIDKIMVELRNEVHKSVETLAMDAIQVIETRIIETGIGSDGVKLKPYDPKYAEYKKSKGYVSDHVTLKLTGDMWASLGILERKNDAGKYEVVVGFRDLFSNQKASGNAKYRGDFLKLSKEEEKDISEDFKNRIKQILQKI